MFKKNYRIMVLIILAASLTLFFGMRTGLIVIAKARAQVIVQTVPQGGDPDAEIVAIATALGVNFDHSHNRFPLLWRLRPVLTNALLPGFIRLPEGVIETIYPLGWCDNATRQLHYVLARRGYDSKQWNMITAKGGHTVLQVQIGDGRKGLVDPYYMLVGWDQNKLSSPQDVQAYLKNGKDPESLLKPLGEGYNSSFYRELGTGFMGAPEDTIRIAVVLPPLRESRVIGLRDGSSDDVSSGTEALGLTPYWHYIGHRYNRGWERSLQVREKTRVTFYFSEKPLSGSLNAIKTTPDMQNDEKITWTLLPGEKLVLADGLAGRSWLRGRSYSGIDQIVFEPLTGL